ncbi:hypothetical protein J2X36_000872 [Methylobacterium sp. BE186]|nr:hypothetical protein [Methylobacterium sp. BE186]
MSSALDNLLFTYREVVAVALSSSLFLAAVLLGTWIVT